MLNHQRILTSILMLVLSVAVVTPALASDKVTKENYERIENGMTKEQVKEILGEPDTKVEQAPIMGMKMDMWSWHDIRLFGKTRGIDVIFTNERVSSKTWIEI